MRHSLRFSGAPARAAAAAMRAPLRQSAAAGPQLFCRRGASGKADPLDLDLDDEPTKEEPADAEPSKEPQAGAAEEEQAERPRRPQRLYTLGCSWNGRTATNGQWLGWPWAQLPQHIKFFDQYRIKRISGIHKHYLVLTECGRVFAWGSNQCGQLGCGADTLLGITLPLDRHAPVLVRTESGEPLTGIVDVSAGKYHSCAVDKDGRVWTWGSSNSRGLFFWRRTFLKGSGCLLGTPGRNGLYVGFTPYAVPIDDFGPDDGAQKEEGAEEGAPPKQRAVQVACGAVHTIVLDAEGGVWTWGDGEWGRLGQEDNNDRRHPELIHNPFRDPESDKSRIPIRTIAACENVSAFVSRDGALFTCGRDSTRQLGLNSDEQSHLRGAHFEAVSMPQRIDGVKGLTHVSLGSHHALGLNKNGVAYFWGGKESNKGPQPYTDFGKKVKQQIAKVDCGAGLRGDHRAFLTTDGVLYLTGQPWFNQVIASLPPAGGLLQGLRQYLSSWVTTRVGAVDCDLQCPVDFQKLRVVDVCCGHASTVVLAEDLEGEEAKERKELLDSAFQEAAEARQRRMSRVRPPLWRRVLGMGGPAQQGQQAAASA
eukprot:TRINITY_DN11812_c0_g1_i1.p1 TRINITY_DN11812_c0_g1~~TRINITY_DN11812_c0_g1_i1.p1  ORF type:complete len:592 (+),score=167.81 TRINITY_DN11812_c0_g1_i1:97-1872(+)